MRDGVRLAADVLVADDGGPHPVLLVRTPYGRASLREAYDPVALARDGWAVVLQDVRGRLDSEGSFQPFAQEVEDGYDTLDWCTQQPWCDGRVAMAGASYNAATQWLAAASGHPALMAIAPAVIGRDLRNHFCYQADVLEQGLLAGWAVGIAASGNDPELAEEAAAVAADWPQVLVEADQRERISRLLPEYGTWADDTESWWKSVTVAEEAMSLPGWHLAGWYDCFCEGSLESYQAAVAAGAAQRLVVGPWAHVSLYQRLVGEVDFGPSADGHGYGLASEMSGFLRAAVDGMPPARGAQVFVMGDNCWREVEAWPPPATPLRWNLAASGAISASSWMHDHDDPVPSHGGRTLLGVGPSAGPVDQRPIHARDDVVVWTSEPLSAPLTVIGTVMLSTAVRCTSNQLDLCVTLCDVHPDGTTLNVVEGVARARGIGGTERELEVRVGSTAITFKQGHRLALSFAAASWPRFEPSPSGDYELDVARTTLTLPVTEGTA